MVPEEGTEPAGNEMKSPKIPQPGVSPAPGPAVHPSPHLEELSKDEIQQLWHHRGRGTPKAQRGRFNPDSTSKQPQPSPCRSQIPIQGLGSSFGLRAAPGSRCRNIQRCQTLSSASSTLELFHLLELPINSPQPWDPPGLVLQTPRGSGSDLLEFSPRQS